jgi:hypothetical protein
LGAIAHRFWAHEDVLFCICAAGIQIRSPDPDAAVRIDLYDEPNAATIASIQHQQEQNEEG